jgi:hypothetical protein
MSYVGAQGGPQAARFSRGAHDPEVQGAGEVVRFRAEKRAPEAEAGRRAPVMLVDVAESAASRRAVHRAVVLGVEKMEHADCEEYDESDDHGLFHSVEIIPRAAGAVNPPAGAGGKPESLEYLIIWTRTD